MFRRVLIGMGLCAALVMGGFPGCRGEDHDRKKQPPPPPPADLFEPNDDPGTCATITFPFVQADLPIHTRVDEDRYCFALGCTADLVLTMGHDHDTGNLDLELLDDSQTVIRSSTSTTQDLELIVTSLTPGDYSIRVWSPDHEVNTYAMEATAGIPSRQIGDPQEPNDDPAGCTVVADPVDVLPHQVLCASIHDIFDEDWYSFSLSQVATLDAEITFFHVIGNLDMELLDTSLNVLARGDSHNNNEEIIAALPAGSYYLRVSGVGGETNTYFLGLTATPGLRPDVFEPNDDPATCNGGPGDLGVLTGIPVVPTWESTVPLTLDTIFDEDYFCFDLATPASVLVDLIFIHDDGNVDLEILDSTLAVIGFSRSFTDDERVVLEGLPAGHYIIHVSAAGGAATTFGMKVTVLEPDPFEPNEDGGTCAGLGDASTGILERFLTIHDGSDQDWLCFDLPPRGTDWDVTIDVLFQDWVGDLDLELYDAQLNLIGSSSTPDDNEQIVQVLPAGMYVLRVHGAAGDLNRYDLNILGI